MLQSKKEACASAMVLLARSHRAIEQHVEDPLSEDILRGSFKDKDLIKITMNDTDPLNKHLYFEAVKSEAATEAPQLAQATSDAT